MTATQFAVSIIIELVFRSIDPAEIVGAVVELGAVNVPHQGAGWGVGAMERGADQAVNVGGVRLAGAAEVDDQVAGRGSPMLDDAGAEVVADAAKGGSLIVGEVGDGEPGFGLHDDPRLW